MNSTDAEFKANLHNYFNVLSLIDYMLYGILSTGLDAFGKNQIYMTYDAQTWLGGMYDMDSTWGLHWNGSQILSNTYSREQFEDYKNTSNKGNLLYVRLQQLFINEIKIRYTELRQTIFTYPYLVNKFEEFIQICPQDIVKEDYANTTANGAYTGIPSKTTNNIQQLRANIDARLAYVDSYINSLVEATPCTAISLNKSTLEFTENESIPKDEVIDITQNTTPGSLSRGKYWVDSQKKEFGSIIATTSDTTTDFISCTSNNTLTITQPSSQYGCGMVAYDVNKNAIAYFTKDKEWTTISNDTKGTDITDLSVDVTNPPKNTAYIRICFNLTDLSNVVVTKKYSNSSTSQEKLIATVTPTNTTDKVIWSVSPTGICTVENGVVTPVKNGSCVITVTCGTQTATCNVTVNGIYANPVYTLAQATTFDGTNNIDTGIKLFDKDKAFTIYLNFNGEIPQSAGSTVFTAFDEASPYAGVKLAVYGTYKLLGVNSTEVVCGTADTNIHKLILTKDFGSTSVNVYYDTTTPKTVQCTGTHEYTTILGSAVEQDSTIYRAWKGTINQFKIWFRTLTNDEINALLN